MLSVITFVTYADFSNDKVVVKKPIEIIKQNREPSSIQAPTPVVPAVSEDVINLGVFCRESVSNATKAHQKTKKSLVMLNLKVCEELKSARHIWILNRTNGFKAQIFKVNMQNFRTDFVQLNSGLNDLRIEAVLKNGQTINQSVKIESPMTRSDEKAD